MVAHSMMHIGHQFHNASLIIFGDIEFNVFQYILAHISRNTTVGATSITYVRDFCLSNIPTKFRKDP